MSLQRKDEIFKVLRYLFVIKNTSADPLFWKHLYQYIFLSYADVYKWMWLLYKDAKALSPFPASADKPAQTDGVQVHMDLNLKG